MSESREDRLKILAATGVLGRAPQAFIDTFLDTGIIDGALWPITVPVIYSSMPEKAS